MKKFKRIMALVIALAMVLGMTSMAAFATEHSADDSHTVTITPTNTKTAHTYEAYQIFKGVLDADQDDITGMDPVQLNSIAWGDNADGAKILAALKADSTLGTDFANATDAVDVAAVLATYTSDDAKMRAFAALLEATDGALKGTPVTSDEAEANSAASISGLKDGYYFIKDVDESQDGENGSYTRFILRVVGDTEITAKDVLPDIDKEIAIDADDDDDPYGDDDETTKTSNGSIGDKVNYKVSGKVPNMDGYESYLYQVSDTMTEGLTFNDDIAITINGTALEEVAAAADGRFFPVTKSNGAVTLTDGQATPDATKPAVTAGYVVTRSATGFTLYIVNFIQYNVADDPDTQGDEAIIGKDIIVTYSATINENAMVEDGNVNTAQLTYSNNPNQSDKGDNGEPAPTNPTGEGPEKKTTTFTTGLELLKIDDQDTTKKLAGAAFTITGEAQNIAIVNETKYALDDEGTYYLLKDGTYTTTVPGSTVDGKEVSADDYVSTTEKYKPVTTVTKEYNGSETTTAGGVTGNDGLFTAEGLGEGLYTITETQAPTGYNALANPIFVYVKFVPDDTDITASSFKVYKYKDSETAPTITDSTDFTSSDWTELTSTGNTSTLDFDITVPNNGGSELPSTGGIGTTIFYVVGAILVIGAGVVLITRRRMDA